MFNCFKCVCNVRNITISCVGLCVCTSECKRMLFIWRMCSKCIRYKYQLCGCSLCIVMCLNECAVTVFVYECESVCLLERVAPLQSCVPSATSAGGATQGWCCWCIITPCSITCPTLLPHNTLINEPIGYTFSCESLCGRGWGCARL